MRTLELKISTPNGIVGCISADEFLHTEIKSSKLLAGSYIPHDSTFYLTKCLIFVFFFDTFRYVSIVQKEGLEISQPALDYSKSEVHHQITARLRGSIAHRSLITFSFLILIFVILKA